LVDSIRYENIMEEPNFIKLKSASVEYSYESGLFLLHSHNPEIAPFEFNKREMKQLITCYMESSKVAMCTERDIFNITSDPEDADQNSDLLMDHDVHSEVFIRNPEKGTELRFVVRVWNMKVYNWLLMFYYPKGSNTMKPWKGGCIFSRDEDVVLWRKFVNYFG